MTSRAKVAWGFVALLGILHYDFWWWADRSLVFGFLPIGLFYHAAYTVACSALMWLLVRHQWPAHLERVSGASVPE
jgi:hypothetical protein